MEEQKEYLQSIVEAIDHPLYIIDAKDYTLKIANSACNFGDINAQTKCYAALYGGNKPCEGENQCPLEIVKETKKHIILDHIHRDAQNKTRNLEIHGFPVFDENGNISQVIVSTQDVTTKKDEEKKTISSLKDLKLFKEITVGRENLMIELKKEVNKLSEELGRPSVYDLSFLNDE